MIPRNALAFWTSSLVLACFPGLALAQPGDDCNNNGIPDQFDLAQGQSQDRNNNGSPDECDIEITFDQLNWSNGQGGYVSAFSDYGRANLVFDQTDLPLLYPHPDGGFYGWINIMTRTNALQPAWSIQNLAVHFDANHNFAGELPLGVWFSLAVPPGTPVNTIDYSIVITQQPLPAPMGGPIRYAQPVAQDDVLFGGVESEPGEVPPAGGTSADSPPGPAMNFNGAPAGTFKIGKPAAIRVAESSVEKVEEEKDACGPGSIARSLKYLIPTMALTAQEIYEILKGGGYMGAGGVRGGATTAEITTGKAKFVSQKIRSGEIGGKIDTDVEPASDIEQVIPLLTGGADVEIIIQWPLLPGQTQALRHIAFVSKITPKYDASGRHLTGYDVETLDDEQGKTNAGNQKKKYSFDKNGNMLDAAGNPTGGKALSFVVEKYQPPTKKPDKVRK